MKMTFYGINGEEVVGTQVHQVSDANGRYMFDTILTTDQVAQNLAAGRQVTSSIEWECQGCMTVVSSSEGHDNYECKEAAFQKNEDRLADYRE